ncbi:prosaposin [Spea bombifrons]|uniref:prosaposin n=1 Tax=Spea bombifrons TaxID=233779 RepID=UPI0023496F97|nr:prosaposin [Spea bombifrons]
MSVLLVLSCVLAAVTASPLFGTEQCAGGPVIWCENVQTASQCGAVKHCQQTVWNKPTLKSVPCDLCKEVLTILGGFLKDNATENEFEGYLKKVCSLIPDPSISSPCEQLVDEYFPIIFNILKEELDNPSTVCSALGLCKSLQQYLASFKQHEQIQSNEIPETDAPKMVYPFLTNIPLLLYPQGKTTPEPKNGDVCKDCLQLINDVQDSIRSNSSFSKQLVDQVLKDCDQLGGGLSDMCKTYVKQYSDIAIQVLLQMKPEQLCALVGFCDQKSAPLQTLTPAKEIIPAAKLQPAIQIKQEASFETNPICELCQIMVQELESLLEDERTEESIEKALEKVCNIIPHKYTQKCKDFVETYSKAIISLLEQEVNPKMICSILGVCSAREHAKIVKLNPEKVKSGGSCQVCKMIVKYIDELLEKNATELKIQDALKKVCNFLPDSVQDECRALVAEYEPMFVQILLQALEPSFVCMKMNLCDGAKIPLLGTEKCMRGPSYWCKDVNTATACNAIEHCKRHVWN